MGPVFPLGYYTALIARRQLGADEILEVVTSPPAPDPALILADFVEQDPEDALALLDRHLGLVVDEGPEHLDPGAIPPLSATSRGAGPNRQPAHRARGADA
jgi:hypothetical protein